MAVDSAQAYDEDIHLIREADDEEGQALEVEELPLARPRASPD